MNLLKQNIEALVFASEESITLKEISATLKSTFDWEISDEDILTAIAELKEKYASEEFAFSWWKLRKDTSSLPRKVSLMW